MGLKLTKKEAELARDREVAEYEARQSLKNEKQKSLSMKSIDDIFDEEQKHQEYLGFIPINMGHLKEKLL